MVYSSKQALEVIEAYSKHNVRTPALLQEVTVLAQAGNIQISHEILKIIVSQLASAFLLDTDLLTALRDVLRATDPEHLDADDLVNILKILCSKHDSFHTQSSTLPKLYQLLYVLSGTLEVMGDANVEKLSYDNLHDPLYKALGELLKHDDWRIAALANYTREALLRVNHDKTKLMLFLGRAISFGEGLGSISRVVLDKNLSALMEAYQNFKTALHSQKRKGSWYDEVRFCSILVEVDQFDSLTSHLTAINIPTKERPFFLSGLCLLLIHVISDHKEPTARISMLRLLISLCEDKTWELDKKKKPMSTIRMGILGQLKEWAQTSSPLSKIAQEALDRLGSSSTVIPETLSLVKSAAPTRASSSVLLHEAKARPKLLPELIQQLREYYVSGEEIKRLLATYISPQGSHSSSIADSFPLEKGVTDFLQSDQKVLLLQGGSGSGKTTFGTYFAHHLWKHWKEDSPICLFIPPGVLASTNKAIEKTLKGHGFSDQQILQLKKEHRFVFVFDGFDEMGKRVNLYQKNRVFDWNAKVIVSCRTQYLSGDYRSLFAPLTNDAPRSALFREFWIAPFTDKEIDAYLQQYLSQVENPIWKDYREYKKYILQIPGLRDLISTPFLLYITAEVLPEIVQCHMNKDPGKKIELLKLDLYDAFIAKWFNRAEVRLRNTGKLSDMRGDVKLSFIAYCKKLAAKMFAQNTTVVTYTPPVWGEEISPWEDFFGDQAPLPLLRSAAPLKKVDENQFAFLHKSIFEYFVYKEGFDQIIKWAQRPSQPRSFRSQKRNEEKITSVVSSSKSSTAKKTVTKVSSSPVYLKSLPVEQERVQVKVKPRKKSTLTSATSLPDNFALKLLVDEPAVIAFYSDAVLKYPSLKQTFFEFIELSKHDASKAIAAANSITILNVARIPFTRRDFRGIRVPGANLYGAILDGACLDKANLRDTILKDVFLRDCSLKQTQIKGAWFGEYAYLKGHTDKINSCTFSPDGSRIISASRDQTVRIWDANSGKELASLKGHTEEINSCAFSPDGSRIISASRDQTVRIWDANSGKELASLKGHTEEINSCAFSPDGNRIISASRDQTVRIWDANSGKELASLQVRAKVTSCAFSPDGNRIISGGDCRTLCIWDAKTRKKLASLEGHKNSVSFCTFSPDGKKILSASYYDKIVHLWDANTGKQLISLQHAEYVTSCAFSPDGKRIISTGRDQMTVRIWDANTGIQFASLQGHTREINSCAFSPDGNRIISAGWDQTVRIWNASTEKMFSSLQGHTSFVSFCAFSPDGKRIFSRGYYEKTVRMWDAKSGKQLASLGHTDEVTSCALSPNGKRIVSGDHSNAMHIWDTSTGAKLASLKGHTSMVVSCAFSPNGRRIISGSWDHTVRIWDAKSGKQLASLGHTGMVKTCAFSPDGRRIISGGDDKTVHIWDANSGKELVSLKGHTKKVNSCGFSPKGQCIISEDDRTIRIWNAKTGMQLASLESTNCFESYEFSPDSRYIISAARTDKAVRIWDATTGIQLASLDHMEAVYFCTFSPDGKKILSTSYDNTIRIWDTKTRKELASLEGHVGRINSCTFSPDGKRIVSGSVDNTVRIWEVYNGRKELDPRLLWSSMPLLFVERADIQGAQLSEANAALLKQRGAIGI